MANSNATQARVLGNPTLEALTHSEAHRILFQGDCCELTRACEKAGFAPLEFAHLVRAKELAMGACSMFEILAADQFAKRDAREQDLEYEGFSELHCESITRALRHMMWEASIGITDFVNTHNRMNEIRSRGASQSAEAA